MDYHYHHPIFPKKNMWHVRMWTSLCAFSSPRCPSSTAKVTERAKRASVNALIAMQQPHQTPPTESTASPTTTGDAPQLISKPPTAKKHKAQRRQPYHIISEGASQRRSDATQRAPMVKRGARGALDPPLTKRTTSSTKNRSPGET